MGAGLIGLQAHIPAWLAQPGAELAVVVDSDAIRAEYAARTGSVPNWSSDFDDVVLSGNVDIVDICTPPDTHHSLTSRALAAGKHVLLEKPIAPTLDEALSILHAARGSDSVLMVAENWPFATATERIHQLVSSGVLGDLYMYQAVHESDQHLASGGQPSWIRDNAAAGGGILMQSGIHCITAARHLMGEVESVVAYRTSNAADTVPARESNESDIVLALQFASGGVGTISVTARSRHVGPRRLGQVVHGDRGIADFDVLRGLVRYDNGGVSYTEQYDSPSMGFQEEIAEFLACIRTGRRPSRFSVEDQLASLAVVLAAYQSQDARRPVNPDDVLSRARSAHNSPTLRGPSRG